jgi:hypothetical protein
MVNAGCGGSTVVEKFRCWTLMTERLQFPHARSRRDHWCLLARVACDIEDVRLLESVRADVAPVRGLKITCALTLIGRVSETMRPWLPDKACRRHAQRAAVVRSS